MSTRTKAAVVRCGNRRATECPSCSRLYAADTFHLTRAVVAGGKTVPETVAENPLVFATVTAPSFGRVHGRRDGARRCHPTSRGQRTYPHGRPRACLASHAEDDPLLGQPLCDECYDQASHVIWQWWAPDLWRRFTVALRRLVAKTLDVPASRLGDLATVQYAKVAEYQLRGVIHFHALVRLYGPKTPEGFAPAPASIEATLLADLVGQAAASVRLAEHKADGRPLGTRVPRGRGVRTEIRPFAEDELKSFHVAASARDQRLADVLLIASWTGLVGQSSGRCESATSCGCPCLCSWSAAPHQKAWRRR